MHMHMHACAAAVAAAVAGALPLNTLKTIEVEEDFIFNGEMQNVDISPVTISNAAQMAEAFITGEPPAIVSVMLSPEQM